MKKSVVSQLILSFDVVCVATATQEVSVSSTGSLGAGGAVSKICRKISWYGLVAILPETLQGIREDRVPTQDLWQRTGSTAPNLKGTHNYLEYFETPAHDVI